MITIDQIIDRLIFIGIGAIMGIIVNDYYKKHYIDKDKNKNG